MDDAAKIEGSWKPDDRELAMITLTIKAGRYTVEVADNTVADGAYVLDTSTTPMSIEISNEDGPNAGKTIAAIYEFSDELLRICYALDGGPKPVGFTHEPEKGLQLVTYRRRG